VFEELQALQGKKGCSRNCRHCKDERWVLEVIAREARAFFFLVDEQNKNCVNGWAIPATTVLLMRISGKGFFWVFFI
jgi:hypothetical protein